MTLQSFILFLSLWFSSSLFAAEPPLELVTIKLTATDKGFEPKIISADPGKSLRLIVTRDASSLCQTTLRIPDKNINRIMPKSKSVVVNLGVLEKGSMHFGCGIEMADGGIIYVK